MLHDDALLDAAEHILEAVMFESWLRFSFLEDMPDAPAGPDGEPPLMVRLDEAARRHLAEKEAALLPLALMVDGREATFELSREAICRYVLEELEGKGVIPAGSAAEVLDSPAFQLRLQLFNNWLQEQESVLERAPHDFADWRIKFGQWRSRPDVVEQTRAALAPTDNPAEAAGDGGAATVRLLGADDVRDEE
ncbi:MAG TPA: hypothetical protein H9784_01705 [Candidatus Desulfovibrio intestinavium]|uniref:Uncharacterized protein n=1 Tax=Candidatus Desulfovibrio intestinavium TaxID=2838534 RepID=A0A9D2HJV9_9BACT|nr:hypothetical protein [Candidatus Desulfovibrio intestinavium]